MRLIVNVQHRRAPQRGAARRGFCEIRKQR